MGGGKTMEELLRNEGDASGRGVWNGEQGGVGWNGFNIIKMEDHVYEMQSKRESRLFAWKWV